MLEAVYDAIFDRFENGGLSQTQLDDVLKLEGLDTETPMISLILEPRVQVRFYTKGDRWLFLVFKVNKNGSVSKKRFDGDHFAISMRPEEVRDPLAVAAHFCKWILNFEIQEGVSEILPESPEFQNLIRGALLRDSKKRSQEAITTRMAKASEESSKNDFKWFWGFVIFLILGMILFGAKGGGSSGCAWVSDPRGGYSDC